MCSILVSQIINLNSFVHFYSEFFVSMDWKNLCDTLKSSVQIMVGIAKEVTKNTETLNTINSFFHRVVQISGALYCISDIIEIPVDLLQLLIVLISIPWLAQCDPPWSDLPHKFSLSVDAMVTLGSSLGPVINRRSKDVCLHLLAAFPSDTAPTWRTQVFLLALVFVVNYFLWKSVLLK